MKTKILLPASFLLMNLFISSVANCQWVSQNIPLNGGIMICLRFTDNDHGAIGGWVFNNFKDQIQANGYYTNDGGVTWNESSIADSIRALTDIKFISAQTGFAVGAYNPLAESKIIIKNFVDQATYNFNNYTGMISGGQDYKAAVMKTTDGGASWHTFGDIPGSLSYLESIDITDTQNVYVSTSRQVGNDIYPGIYKTDINFQHWIKYPIPFDSGDVRKIIHTENCIIGTGFKGFTEDISKGVVIRSGDNGLTWSLNEFPSVIYCNDLRFLNENTGFVSGVETRTYQLPGSGIFRTTNNGLSWTKLQVDLDSLLVFGMETVKNSEVVYFYAKKFKGTSYPFESTGSVIGRSDDAGLTWTLQPVLNTYSMLLNCQALSSQEAYCVGAYYNMGIGQLHLDPIVLKTTNGGAVSVSSQDQEIPSSISLSQNYPNPFNPATYLEFEISNQGFVSLKVYDILGKEITRLVNDELNTGTYRYKFDGSDLSGGIYFYELQVNNYREVKKMVLLK